MKYTIQTLLLFYVFIDRSPLHKKQIRASSNIYGMNTCESWLLFPRYLIDKNYTYSTIYIYFILGIFQRLQPPSLLHCLLQVCFFKVWNPYYFQNINESSMFLGFFRTEHCSGHITSFESLSFFYILGEKRFQIIFIWVWMMSCIPNFKNRTCNYYYKDEKIMELHFPLTIPGP